MIEGSFTEYEAEIIAEVRGTEEQAGHGTIAPRGARWIRGYLLEVGEDYGYRTWKKYRDFQLRAGLKPVTYRAFLTYFWLLQQMGLLERTREEPGARTPHLPRIYYRVVPGKRDDPLWSKNPYSWIREVSLGKGE
jgi:hypothetical protein